MATKLVSVVTGGSNQHQTTSAEINGIATDFISQGVVGAVSNTSGVAPATGAFAVNAIGTPNMSVRVTNGVAYVTATPTGGTSQTFRVTMDATEDVTIAANATGGTRYDWIYIKLDADKLVNPAVDASDVATLTTSRSTSASTDNGTPPTYGYCIAVVTVANAASSITNSNITDSRTRTGVTNLSTSTSSNNVITAPMLSTSAIKLGYTERTSNFTDTTAGSWVDVTSLTVTVTVPAGGRDIKITAFASTLRATGAAGTFVSMSVREGSNVLGMGGFNQGGIAYNQPMNVVARVSAPSAGSHTYKVSIGQSAAGTITLGAAASGTASLYDAHTPAFILVELI